MTLVLEWQHLSRVTSFRDYKIAYVPSEESDQPAHPSNLISPHRRCGVANDPKRFEHLRRLMRAFVGRTCNLAGKAVHWLILWIVVPGSISIKVQSLSGPRVKLASCKSALNPLVVYSTVRSKAVVPMFVLLFFALWFILRGDLSFRVSFCSCVFQSF